MGLRVVAACSFLLIRGFCDEGTCKRDLGQRLDQASAQLAVNVEGQEPSEGLQLLHTAASQIRSASPRASASLDALGRLADVELLGKEHAGSSLPDFAFKGKSRGQALEEAAMAAAALAVAEEAAAARAVGGGRAAELLASSHRVSKLHSDVAKQAASPPASVVSFHEDAPTGPGSTTAFPTAAATSRPSSEPFHPGINPFNPFRNPFFNPFVPNPYAAFSGSSGGGGGHKLPTIFIVLIVGVVIALVAGLCIGVFDQEEEESSGDDDDTGNIRGRRRREKIRDAIVKGEGHGNRYSWCCCGLCGICGICSPKVILFFLFAILVTCIGGAVLWNSGILQPLLAQLLLYAYIIVLITAFVSVLLWEATESLRKAISHIFGKVDQMDQLIPHWLVQKAKITKRPNEKPQF